MKFSVVVCLLSFFIIATHSASIPQTNDAEASSPTAKDYLKKVIHGAFVAGAELTGMLESPDAEKLNHLQKRAESIFIDAYHMFYQVGVTVVDIYKDVDKEIHEQYPTYRKEVMPIFEKYCNDVFKYVLSFKDEIIPQIKKANLEVVKIQLEFFSHVKTLFENHKDKLQSFRDDMNAKIKPLVAQVQEEVKAAEKKDSGHKQLDDEERQKYAELMKAMFPLREEDANKVFEYFEQTSTKA